jgi:hypothetical protein
VEEPLRLPAERDTEAVRVSDAVLSVRVADSDAVTVGGPDADHERERVSDAVARDGLGVGPDAEDDLDCVSDTVARDGVMVGPDADGVLDCVSDTVKREWLGEPDSVVVPVAVGLDGDGEDEAVPIDAVAEADRVARDTVAEKVALGVGGSDRVAVTVRVCVAVGGRLMVRVGVPRDGESVDVAVSDAVGVGGSEAVTVAVEEPDQLRLKVRENVWVIVREQSSL